MTTDPTLALADAIDALTRPRTHREPYTILTGAATPIQRHHVTEVASLLDQLAALVEPSGSTGAGHRVPASNPAARLEAIDTLMQIDTEATHWATLLGIRERFQLAETLRSLVGGMTSMDADDGDRVKLAKNAETWVTWAMVATGWEIPAFRPDNTCPLCAERGTLRIRVGDGTARAACLGCRQTWEWDSIGLLAEHIRLENGEEALYRDDEGMSA